MKSASCLISMCLVEMLVVLVCIASTHAGRLTYPTHLENRCKRSCPIEHPQDIVCNSQFVVKAEIVSKVVRTEETFLFGEKEIAHYTVRVLSIFKGRDLISTHQDEDELLMITSANSDMSIPCGYPRLVTGERYLLTGFEDGDSGFLKTEDCQWNEKWNDLTTNQELGLIKNIYTENCDCQIITSVMTNPEYGNEVLTEYVSVGKSCFLDHSTEDSLSRKRSCVKDCRYGKGCSWVRNNNYRSACSNNNQLHNALGN